MTQRELEELDLRVLEGFLSKLRRSPHRPQASRTSTLVIRKEAAAFYYAIYDHDLGRFTALQYRPAPDAPLRTIEVPTALRPPTHATLLVRHAGPECE